MDLVMLPAILNVVAPVLITLGLAAIPISIIWIAKHHQLRMKELELESQRFGGPSAQQLAAIEARLAAIEAALGQPAALANPISERAALLEGPATAAQPVRTR